MSLGTKWRIEFETITPIGDGFIEGVILDCIGETDDNKPIAQKIKVTCLKELTEEEYRKHDEEIETRKNKIRESEDEWVKNNAQN